MFVGVDLTPLVGKWYKYSDAPWMQKPNAIADILGADGAEYGVTNGGAVWIPLHALSSQGCHRCRKRCHS